MAKKKITKKGRISVVKKRWFGVIAPQVFNSVNIGETPAIDVTKLPGRSIKANLSLLVKSGRRQNVDVTLKITEVKGSDCLTEFTGLEMAGPFIKRLVKKAKTRIDDSFVVVTKDEIKVRLKPMLLVRGNVQRGVLTDLRNKTKKILTAVAKESTLNELINKVLRGDVTKGIRGDLKHICQVSSIEMRAMAIVKK